MSYRILYVNLTYNIKDKPYRVLKREALEHGYTRKDSIWFAVRDGKGFALRNLGAYLGRTDLKKSVSFFANRVPGTAPSYAAVRALQDYAERYVHA